MSILVTGATGNIGRQVVDDLLAEGHAVRALTRNPGAADLPEGVEVVAGDLTDPPSLEGAFDGVTAVHLLSTHGPTYAPLETGPELMALAAKAGVRKAVLLWSGDRTSITDAVEASGLEWTHLQSGDFMSNVLLWADDIKRRGVVRDYPGKVGLGAVVDPSDVAAVAAAVLTGEGHAGKHYWLTGPELLTAQDEVAILAETLGRDLRFEALTADEFRAWLREFTPDDSVANYVIAWRDDPPPLAERVADTVERLTGRPPRSFADWAADHIDHFR